MPKTNSEIELICQTQSHPLVIQLLLTDHIVDDSYNIPGNPTVIRYKWGENAPGTNVKNWKGETDHTSRWYDWKGKRTRVELVQPGSSNKLTGRIKIL